MSKYDDLSDIDQDSREVYETSDIEESFDVQDTIVQRRDSISDAQFDIDMSMAVFEKKVIDSHVTDFSDRIDRLNQTYESYEVRETTQNKLSRIRKELEELEMEIEETGEDEDEVNRLLEMFEKLNRRTKDKKMVLLKDFKVEEAESKNVQGSKPAENPSEVIELSSRLSKLEKSIGLSPLDFQLQSQSLQSSINDLFRKFKLFSNDQDSLKKITEIIDEVNLKFEKSITTRRSLPPDIQHSLDQDSKVNEIFKSVVQTEEFSDDLPYLIRRLESLNEVHMKLNDSVNGVDQMEEQLETLSKDVKNWEDQLTKLETKMGQLSDNFQATKNIV